MTLVSERRVVQNPLIRYAEEAGWTYLPPDEALRLRHGPEQPFLWDVLIAQLKRLNPGVITTVEEANEVIRRLGASAATLRATARPGNTSKG